MGFEGGDGNPTFTGSVEIVTGKSVAEDAPGSRKATAERFGRPQGGAGETDLNVPARLPPFFCQDQAQGCNHDLLRTGPISQASSREMRRDNQTALGLVRQIVPRHFVAGRFISGYRYLR